MARGGGWGSHVARGGCSWSFRFGKGAHDVHPSLHIAIPCRLPSFDATLRNRDRDLGPSVITRQSYVEEERVVDIIEFDMPPGTRAMPAPQCLAVPVEDAELVLEEWRDLDPDASSGFFHRVW